MRFFTACFILLAGAASAQELIPDPGFEMSDRNNHPLYWTQAAGEFNHFYHAYDHAGKTYSGYGYHGLCMYKNEPNEFMHTPLKEKLIKGQVYRVSMRIRLSKNGDEVKKNEGLEEFKSVHWYFSDYPIEVRYKLFLYVTPQVVFSINHEHDGDWALYETEYVAEGHERFLTIGNFTNVTLHEEHKARLSGIRQSIEKLESDRDHEIDSLRKQHMEEVKRREGEPDYDKNEHFGKNARNRLSKKERKKAEEQRRFLSESGWRLNEKVYATEKKYQQKINELEGEYVKRKNPFSVNYCFDEIRIVPVEGKRLSIETDYSKKEPETGKIIELKNVFFETAQSELLPESRTELDRLLFYLEKYPSLRIRICGHTDSDGDDQYNLRLSQARAAAVMHYLIAGGIAADRLSSTGFGSEYPVADNFTEGGKKKNRRVEFYVAG